MTWLHENAQWVFSGIGVLVLSLVISGIVWWLRSKKKTSAHPTSLPTAGNTQQPATTSATKEITLTRFFETRRVNSGDYAIFKTPDGDVRVTLRAIVPNAQEQRRYSSDPEFLADVEVDLGGAVIEGGKKCRHVTVNRYHVPAVTHDESQESLFAFSNTPTHVRFINLRVDHINAHSSSADITLISLRKWFSGR